MPPPRPRGLSMGKTLWIRNPSGRVVEVPEDNGAVDKARKGVKGWAIVDPPELQNHPATTLPAEPVTADAETEADPPKPKRRRGRPRKTEGA